jgi:hypothetical protein
MRRVHRLFSLLLDPDPADNPPSGPPPPAAKKVVDNPEVKETDASEIVALRSRAEKAEADKKKVEMRAAELEDENRQLRAVTPKPGKQPAPEPAPEKQSFLSGARIGFFDL